MCFYILLVITTYQIVLRLQLIYKYSIFQSLTILVFKYTVIQINQLCPKNTIEMTLRIP